MDFAKLGRVKRHIISRAAVVGYVYDKTYPKEKSWLHTWGWLTYEVLPDGEVTNRMVLTEYARRKIEGHKLTPNGLY